MSGNHLLSLAGWTVLPNLVTGWLQSLYYGLMIRAGDPRPQPGSPRYILHRRRIHIIVVSAYLLYTIYEADWDIRRASDFYQDLAVPHSASERDIKSRFRRLAALHHPDKVGSSPQAENYFVHLKRAQDTLLNPAKRYAYERFGPEMLEWQRCSSIGDYVSNGVQAILPYYGAAAIFMIIFGYLGYFQFGTYWRWLTLICIGVHEYYAITRPYYPWIATTILNPFLTTFTRHPPYLPFQIIQLARKLSVTFYIALSQIGPLLQPAAANAPTEVALKQQLDRLENTARVTDTEASRLMSLELTPFVHDPVALKDVQGKIKEWLVQNTIKSDPEVRDVMGRILKKKREDAPAGAKGTK